MDVPVCVTTVVRVLWLVSVELVKVDVALSVDKLTKLLVVHTLAGTVIEVSCGAKNVVCSRAGFAADYHISLRSRPSALRIYQRPGHRYGLVLADPRQVLITSR